MDLNLYCYIYTVKTLAGGNIPLLLVDLMNCMHHHVWCATTTEEDRLITFNSKILPFCTHSDPILYSFHKLTNMEYIAVYISL